MSCIVPLLLSALAVGAPSGALAPHLTASDVAAIHALRSQRKANTDLELAEKTYHRLTQKQIFRDLQELYDPARQAQVTITYPGFTPRDAARPDGDLGFGLHVLRRLRYDVDGREKIIEALEHWNEDPATGALLPPDEVRVKTLAFEGERHGPGSQDLYLFDVLRLMHLPTEPAVEIYRRTLYSYDHKTKRNRHKAMRVPMSSPYSCVGCHRVDNPHAAAFAGEGEKIDPERIVQDSFFRKPLDTTPGFRDWLAHLERQGRPDAFRERARKALLKPAESFALPQFGRALRAAENAPVPWLPEDFPAWSHFAIWPFSGAYQNRRGARYVDALDLEALRRGFWLAPPPVVPGK